MGKVIEGLIDFMQNDRHPDQVKKAYGLLNESLARDEQGQWDENFTQNFSNYLSLMDQDKQDQGVSEWKDFEREDPLTRWRKQIDGMIQSGNPVLMEKGLQMLDNQFNRETDSGSDGRTTAIKEWQFAQSQGYQGGFSDWKNSQRPQNYENSLDKVVPVGDLKNYSLPGERQMPVAPTFRDLRTMGAQYQAPKAADTAGRLAMLNTATQLFPLLDTIILDDKNGVNERVLDGAFYIGLDPTPGHVVSTKGLEGVGGYSPSELEQSKQIAQAFELGFQAITRTETGAAMPPEEVQNTKARFQPLPTDPPPVKRQRYLAYKYFIENAINMIDPQVQKSGSAQQLADEVNKAVTKALEKYNVDGAGGDEDDMDYGED